MIFAVFDVLLAVNMCINYSFFLQLYHSFNQLQTAFKNQYLSLLAQRLSYHRRCIVGDVTYEDACSMFEMSTLADRREELMRHFFDQLKCPDSCFAHLMPAKRELSLINYLRHACMNFRKRELLDM